MRVGAVFPQTEAPTDREALRAYARTVAEIGFKHILIYDHVVGADPAAHTGWDGAYDVTDEFHEPFVLFGFLAAVCDLELVTAVLILPQRQTVLVAKQAAQVDLLTRGRFRMGVGLGWNPVEYEALGESFARRGERLEEQIGLLRRLWTEPSLTASAAREGVTGAGIAPLPIQRPIPLWIGGRSPRALRRIGRLADGWMPMGKPGRELEAAAALVHEGAVTAGRDPDTLGLEGRIHVADADHDRIAREACGWRAAGATHVGLITAGGGLATLDDHFEALAAGHAAVESAG